MLDIVQRCKDLEAMYEDLSEDYDNFRNEYGRYPTYLLQKELDVYKKVYFWNKQNKVGDKISFIDPYSGVVMSDVELTSEASVMAEESGCKFAGVYIDTYNDCPGCGGDGWVDLDSIFFNDENHPVKFSPDEAEEEFKPRQVDPNANFRIDLQPKTVGEVV